MAFNVKLSDAVAEAMLKAHKQSYTKLLTNNQIMGRLLVAALEKMVEIGMATTGTGWPHFSSGSSALIIRIDAGESDG